MNLAAAAELFAILTIVFQHVYHETRLRLTLLQMFSAVNIKIILSQVYILHLELLSTYNRTWQILQ